MPVWVCNLYCIEISCACPESNIPGNCQYECLWHIACTFFGLLFHVKHLLTSLLTFFPSSRYHSSLLPGTQFRLLLSMARRRSSSATICHSRHPHFHPPILVQHHLPHLHAPPRWEATLPAFTQDGYLWGVVCNDLWIPVRHICLTLLCAHHQTDVSSHLLTPLPDCALLSSCSRLQETKSCGIHDSVLPPFINPLGPAYPTGHCWYISLLLLPAHEHFL